MGELLNELRTVAQKPRVKTAIDRLKESADKQTIADFEAAIKDITIPINTIHTVLKRRGLPTSYSALTEYRRKVLTK